MNTASFKKYTLYFKRPSGTSRGVLTEKDTWFLRITDGQKIGIGECNMFKGLSYDDRSDYEEKLHWVCEHIELGREALWEQLREFPSIQFGVEMAFQSLQAEHPFLLFPSDFTEGKKAIPINGLIWMGDQDYMKQQISEKLEAGFNCIKLKIGAIDFEAELNLLKSIRENFSADTIELRVDANGAFSPEDALRKLEKLAKFQLHSIEQPIKPGQVREMAELCSKTPLPIALDEELIGVTNVTDKQELLQTIKPQFAIFKPSLIGGFRGTQEWIEACSENNIAWWITSALESNIGLNAIAQWTYTLRTKMPQGLGTGGLFTNNFAAPLEVVRGQLEYDPAEEWEIKF